MVRSLWALYNLYHRRKFSHDKIFAHESRNFKGKTFLQVKESGYLIYFGKLLLVVRAPVELYKCLGCLEPEILFCFSYYMLYKEGWNFQGSWAYSPFPIGRYILLQKKKRTPSSPFKVWQLVCA